MERVVFDHVWKLYDRRYGSNRFRRLLASLAGRHPERNEFWALSDVSFRLEEGQSLGIVGPNGSGKTTILRILSGISHIARGHVRVRGAISALIALGAGFHPELSGRENIYLNGSILGLRHAEIRRYFDDIVEFAGIGEYIDAPVKRYSSGMFVRLGFAVAAQVRPDVLLVDEVLAVGDARFQTRCHDRIEQLRRDGTVVVLVSHDLWAVRQSCAQGLYLRQGRIVELGDIDRVIAAYQDDVQREAIEAMAAREATTAAGPAGAASCEARLLDAHGRPTSEIRLGAPLTVRMVYHCPEPLARPTLVVSAVAHQGPCAFVLRSRKDPAWDVPMLAGDGHVDVALPRLELSPGRYAISVQIKDERDLAQIAGSRFVELQVHPPRANWCQENCLYVPESRWSPPAPTLAETPDS